MMLAILNIVVPVLLTGIITFLITKYTYHKNRPTDKLEIAYNRVYYPLYLLTKKVNSDETKDLFVMMDKAEIIFVKYEKYTNRTTLNIYNRFKKEMENNNTKQYKELYYLFKDNVRENNSKIRRILGYPEPGLFTLYRYAPKSEKPAFHFLFCITVLYILFMIHEMLPSIYGIQVFFSAIGGLFFVLTIIVIFEMLYYHIKEKRILKRSSNKRLKHTHTNIKKRGV